MKRKMNKYSASCGIPVNKTVVCTMAKGVALIRKIQSSGKVFRVDFKKKDGTLRTLVGRCGVQSAKKGGKAGYNFTDKGLISVYEFSNGGQYRTVNIEEIQIIKYQGVVYSFNAPVPAGEYGTEILKMSGRTPQAHTSPMYN